MRAFRGDGHSEMYTRRTNRLRAARLWQPKCLFRASAEGKSNTVNVAVPRPGASPSAQQRKIQELASLQLQSNLDISGKEVEIKLARWIKSNIHAGNHGWPGSVIYFGLRVLSNSPLEGCKSSDPTEKQLKFRRNVAPQSEMSALSEEEVPKKQKNPNNNIFNLKFAPSGN